MKPNDESCTRAIVYDTIKPGSNKNVAHYLFLPCPAEIYHGRDSNWDKCNSILNYMNGKVWYSVVYYGDSLSIMVDSPAGIYTTNPTIVDKKHDITFPIVQMKESGNGFRVTLQGLTGSAHDPGYLIWDESDYNIVVTDPDYITINMPRNLNGIVSLVNAHYYHDDIASLHPRFGGTARLDFSVKSVYPDGRPTNLLSIIKSIELSDQSGNRIHTTEIWEQSDLDIYSHGLVVWFNMPEGPVDLKFGYVQNQRPKVIIIDHLDSNFMNTSSEIDLKIPCYADVLREACNRTIETSAAMPGDADGTFYKAKLFGNSATLVAVLPKGEVLEEVKMTARDLSVGIPPINISSDRNKFSLEMKFDGSGSDIEYLSWKTAIPGDATIKEDIMNSDIKVEIGTVAKDFEIHVTQVVYMDGDRVIKHLEPNCNVRLDFTTNDCNAFIQNNPIVVPIVKTQSGKLVDVVTYGIQHKSTAILDIMDNISVAFQWSGEPVTVSFEYANQKDERRIEPVEEKTIVPEFQIPEETAKRLSELLTVQSIRERLLGQSLDDPQRYEKIEKMLVPIVSEIEAIKFRITEEYVPEEYRSEEWSWVYDGYEIAGCKAYIIKA